MFLAGYKAFRKELLRDHTLQLVSKLGPGAFATISGEVVKAILLVACRGCNMFDDSGLLDERSPVLVHGIDISGRTSLLDKANRLISGELTGFLQHEQLKNPEYRIVFESKHGLRLLKEIAETAKGVCTYDSPRFISNLWEIDIVDAARYIYCHATVEDTGMFDGRTSLLHWENGSGELADSMRAKGMFSSGVWKAWARYIGRSGVCISQMGDLPCSIFSGNAFDNNAGLIVPKNVNDLSALWCYCSSDEFNLAVRKIDQSLKITNAPMIAVPFDVDRWREVALRKFPMGLPQPYSDDPTQWIFHGHPASSTDALQVAVARLLGYRWPVELDTEMELATDSRAWIDRSAQLNSLVDDDGIVCIPAVASEQPADGRLLGLLHQAFEDGVAQERVFSEKIEGADKSDPLTLDLLRRGWKPALPNDFNSWFNRLLDADGHKGKSLKSWLRDKFFDSHCKRFNQTPFIWHIWDGHREGFSALVNYHKLTGANGRRLLDKLTHSYLGDWINRQQDESKRGVEGADGRLIAARNLKAQLELILAGEPPYDIFVRWKPLHEQPIGWEPDINDGVRLNIRPFMAVDIPGGKKGAGILRVKPNTIKWTKDRGKEVEKPIEDFPWFWDWDGKTQDFTGGETFTGDRWNDLHYTNAFKQRARDMKQASLKEPQ